MHVQEVLLDGEQVSEIDTACLVAECIVQLQTDYRNWKAVNPDGATNSDGKPTCSQVCALPLSLSCQPSFACKTAMLQGRSSVHPP